MPLIASSTVLYGSNALKTAISEYSTIISNWNRPTCACSICLGRTRGWELLFLSYSFAKLEQFKTSFFTQRFHKCKALNCRYHAKMLHAKPETYLRKESKYNWRESIRYHCIATTRVFNACNYVIQHISMTLENWFPAEVEYFRTCNTTCGIGECECNSSISNITTFM